MSSFSNYLWPILLGIYIISPIDAHPLFMDDLIAAGFLIYMLIKNAKRKQQQQQYYHQSQSTGSQHAAAGSDGPMTLDRAYKLLGIPSHASLDEINKAYREKMTKSHPDKVTHLSEELQEKAKELTLTLNEAYDLIKRYKK